MQLQQQGGPFSKSDLIKINPCSGTPQRTQDELVIPANKRGRSQDVGIKYSSVDAVL